MCTAALAEPFVTAHRLLVLETLRTLRVIILACWPRIEQHQVIILRGLVLCWIRVCAEEAEDFQIKRELRNTIKTFNGTVSGTADLQERVDALIAKNETCADLFKDIV